MGNFSDLSPFDEAAQRQGQLPLGKALMPDQNPDLLMARINGLEKKIARDRRNREDLDRLPDLLQDALDALADSKSGEAEGPIEEALDIARRLNN